MRNHVKLKKSRLSRFFLTRRRLLRLSSGIVLSLGGTITRAKPCQGASPEAKAGRVRFGSTDLYVSRLCQGTAFRQVDRSPGDAAGQRILRRCLELGVNFFDSSNSYGWGGAERALGKAIRGHPRDQLVICTKVHPGAKPENSSTSRRVPFTQEFALEQCEGSLKRLGTDYVDLYLLHNPDTLGSIEEVADTMDALVRAGKVRHWGLSNHTAQAVRRVLAHSRQQRQSPPAGLQHYFNITGRHTPEQAVTRLEDEIFPLLREHRLGLMAFSPLAGGKIAPGRTAEPGSSLAKLLGVMDDVAAELAVSRAQIAIAWVLTHPEVTSCLAGAEKPEHVDDNVAGSQLGLPADLLRKLNQASEQYTRQTREGV